jgi:Tol biopolymer transport system component
MRSRVLLVGLSVVAMGLAAAVPPAGASGRDDGTHVVWTTVLDDSFTTARIVAARPDGSGQYAVSHPRQGEFDIDAEISPDGSLVVFERDAGESVQSVVATADGRHEHVLDLGCADPCALVSAPSWSPDGRRLVFTPVIGPFDQVNGSARSAVLYTARLDGSGWRRLSEPGIDGAFEDYRARFSPDGTHLTFVRVRNSDTASAVFVMRSDGTGVHQLTPWGLGGDLPDFSAARRGETKNLVVFETYGQGAPEGLQQDIVTVPATCFPVSDCIRHFRYVTHNGAGPRTSFNPSWSPDGERIAYTVAEFGENVFVGDIWTTRPEGTDTRPVSRSSRFEFRPDWGE